MADEEIRTYQLSLEQTVNGVTASIPWAQRQPSGAVIVRIHLRSPRYTAGELLLNEGDLIALDPDERPLRTQVRRFWGYQALADLSPAHLETARFDVGFRLDVASSGGWCGLSIAIVRAFNPQEGPRAIGGPWVFRFRVADDREVAAAKAEAERVERERQEAAQREAERQEAARREAQQREAERLQRIEQQRAERLAMEAARRQAEEARRQPALDRVAEQPLSPDEETLVPNEVAAETQADGGRRRSRFRRPERGERWQPREAAEPEPHAEAAPVEPAGPTTPAPEPVPGPSAMQPEIGGEPGQPGEADEARPRSRAPRTRRPRAPRGEGGEGASQAGSESAQSE